MIPSALAVLLGSIFLGVLLIRAGAGANGDTAIGDALGVFLGTGLGFGVSSCLFFIGMVVSGAPSLSSVYLEGVLIAGLAFRILRRRRSAHRRKAAAPPEDGSARPEAVRGRIVDRLLGTAFFLTLSLMGAASAIQQWGTPLREIDALAIWNLRARFLFLGGREWKAGFTNLITWSHPDYPLLLPGLVARCWAVLGRAAEVVPVLTAAAFTLATIGLLIAALATLRGPTAAWLSGLALAGTPFFIADGSFQCADVPLSFYFLAALALVCLAARRPGDRRCWLLAGAMAGLGGWTKNEGLLFLAILPLSILLAPVGGFHERLRRMAWLAAGAAPFLLIIWYFKVWMAPPNDILAGQGLGPTLARLTDPARYALVGKAFGMQLLKAGGFLLRPAVLIGLFVLMRLLGGRLDPAGRNERAILFLTLTLTTAGYFFIYIISPIDLTWHLDNSLDRLVLQLTPGFLFLFFLAVPFPSADLDAGRPEALTLSGPALGKSISGRPGPEAPT